MSSEPIQIADAAAQRRKVGRDGMGYVWDVPEHNVRLRADYISMRSDEMHAELSVTRNEGHLYLARFNLTSTTSRTSLVKALDGVTEGLEIPWKRLIEQFSVAILRKEREGEPTRYTGMAQRRPIQYLVDRLVIKGKSNMLFAPGGCIAGETLIEGPDGSRRADELCDSGNPVRVWALGADGVVATWASPVYRKGLADLYEYRFASGRRVIATLAHRFLTETGWRRGDETSVGEQLAVSSPAPRYSGSSSPSESRAGDRRSWRTPEGWMGHCSTYCRRCGLPPQSGASSGQSESPSPAYARGRSRLGFCADAPDSSQVCTRAYPLLRRPSRSSSFPAAPSLAAALFPSAAWPGAGDFGPPYSAPVLALSPVGCGPDRTSHGYGRGAVPSAVGRCACDQHPSPSLYWDTLVSRGYIRTDYYYDLTVPRYENYLANGIWHHNSGKGYLCVALCAAVTGGDGLGDLSVQRSVPFYFDWEDDYDTFNDRLNAVARGMGIDTPRIAYRRMRGLVPDRINEMARAMSDAGATFGIIDSFSAAGGTTSERTSWDTVAHRLFDALDLIPDITWEIIDHVAGDKVGDPVGKAFGSIQKMNRVRNAWEMRSEQEAGSSTVHMKLFDAKWNHTGKRKPMGLCMEFDGDAVSFVSEDPNAPGGAPLIPIDLKMSVQLSARPMKTAELAKACNTTPETIRVNLSRFKERFRRDDEGLVRLVQVDQPEDAPRDLPW